ncbi:MAG: hypothetical protein ACI9DJ_001087 [Algoriphagus sp.]|jgi:hypothetical protein
MHYKQEMKIKETAFSNKLSFSFEAFHEYKHMGNTNITHFIPISENKTQVETEG